MRAAQATCERAHGVEESPCSISIFDSPTNPPEGIPGFVQVKSVRRRCLNPSSRT
jgi:hypothetical protein